MSGETRSAPAHPRLGVASRRPHVLERRFKSSGPKEAMPKACSSPSAVWAESKNLTQAARVFAGVPVGMRTSRKISAALSVTAQRNLVPPASIAPKSLLVIQGSQSTLENDRLNSAIGRDLQPISQVLEPDLQMREVRSPLPPQAHLVIRPR